MRIRSYVNDRASGPLAEFVQRATKCSEADRTALREIFDALFASRAPEFSLQTSSDRDAILMESIHNLLRTSQLSNGKIVISEYHTSVCQHTNGCLVGPFSNSAIEWLNLIVNLLVAKTRSTTVVSAIKNEGPWLLEWISHYKALGVDNIVVYYNDCSDGSAELLQLLAQANEIVAIENIVAPGISPQRQAFIHALSVLRLPHTADWVSFLDSDEFLIADEPLNTIDSMIDAVRTASGKEPVDCIAVNWDWFADADQFAWEEGLVVDRFHAAFEHDMKKCLFRPELATSIFEIHYPLLLEGATIVDSSGVAITDLKKDALVHGDALLRLNHYFAKSFQEFALKKLRGRGARAAGLEIRPFDAFLWASVGTKPRTINASLRSSLANEIERLLAIPGIRDLNKLTEKRARDRLAEMNAEYDLKNIYEKMKYDTEIARRDRQAQGRQDL